MTLNEALAVKARGLTKEQIIAHLRAVAGNNLRHSHNRAGLEGKTVKRTRATANRGMWGKGGKISP